MFDLRPPGCSCASLEDRIAAEFEGVPKHLCPVHDTAAIAEREAAALRANAERDVVRLTAVRAEMEPAPAECSCPDISTSLRAALEGVALVECAAHPSSSGAPSSLPISDGNTISILRNALGRDATVNQFSGDDLPPAA